MAVSHVTKVFAVTDMKIRPVLTDPEGGAMTYGAAVDVPGAKSLTITVAVNSQELRGDNTQLDYDSVIGAMSGSLEFAKLSLDVLSTITDALVVDSGVTPNEQSSWSLDKDTKLAYFSVEAVSASADPIGGDVIYTVAKCMPSSLPEMGLVEEGYKTSTLAFNFVHPIGTDSTFDVAIRETAAAIA